MGTETPREESYMGDILKDLSDKKVVEWMSEKNLATRNKRIFQGFEIYDTIDGGTNSEREVSLVIIRAVGQYPQHVHKESDAFFVIVEGKAIFLSKDEKKSVKKGDTFPIPRGTPHGFELQTGQVLKFISIQSPPIRNSETGDEDFLPYLV